MTQPNHTEKASLVQRYVAAVNSGDLESFDELFAPDYVNHTYRGDQIGPEGMRQFVTRVRQMLANLSLTTDEVIVDDADRIAVRATLRGKTTTAASAIGLEADREVTMREMYIYRITDGRLAERWYVVGW